MHILITRLKFYSWVTKWIHLTLKPHRWLTSSWGKNDIVRYVYVYVEIWGNTGRENNKQLNKKEQKWKKRWFFECKTLKEQTTRTQFYGLARTDTHAHNQLCSTMNIQHYKQIRKIYLRSMEKVKLYNWLQYI